MDNLVLIRVTAALHSAFGSALVREVREQSQDRLLLSLQAEDHSGSIVVSLTPEQPWIGRPGGRWVGPRRPAGPFAARCTKAIGGTALRKIEKLGADRVVALRFADGASLVAELATHGANLILLDGAGRVSAMARRPRSAVERLALGATYAPPRLPPEKLIPFGRPAAEIDRFVLEQCESSGDSAFEVLRRRVFGIGTEGAELVLAEAAKIGATPGVVLHARLRGLEEGTEDPVLESRSDDPLRDAEAGTLESHDLRLLPWHFAEPEGGRVWIRRDDAAGTAGLFHDCLERGAGVRARAEALQTILRAEINRGRSAARRIDSDIEAIADPDRHRIWGEALLAGLSVARRAGDHVIVPDPYDAQGNDLVVPAAASLSVAAAAEEQFRRHRKARRGIEATSTRRDVLRARGARLETIASEFERARSAEDSMRLAERMRAEGIAVGLEPKTRAGRAVARVRAPKLEGVRLYTSSDGEEILVGRSGPDNDRLTFRLAGPEDFWLHAAGTSGAHVILRNPKNAKQPPAAALQEAAALAAWWSDARAAGQVSVHWTRRKHVRRLRGAPPGTVQLKKSASILVRPKLPAGEPT